MKYYQKDSRMSRYKSRLQFETLEARIYLAVDVSGKVFWDANRNGLDDDSHSPDGSVAVSLSSENGSLADGSNATLTLSGNSSNYQLNNIVDFSPNPNFLYEVNAVSANVGTDYEVTFPQQNVLTDSETTYPTLPGVPITKPSWVEAADLDGINGPDIIIANFSQGLLTIKVNDGTGAFADHRQVAVPVNSTSIESVDFEGDGDIDLVVGNLNEDRPTILVNDGNASFSSFVLPTAGSGPFSVVATDVNADNRPDLVTSNFWDHTISVYLNQSTQGQISFAEPNTFDAGNGSAMIAAVNLTGQPGLPNLVVLNTVLNLLLTYDNDGAGGFTYNPTSAVSAMGSNFVTAGYIDGDAYEDVALYTFNQQEVPVYFGDATAGNGNGGFHSSPTVPQTVWYPMGVGIADVDADGDNDLVATQVGGRPPAILRNDGDRNLMNTLPQFGVPLDAIVNVSPALADFDGNGVVDIAYSPAWLGGQIRVSLRQLDQGDHVFPTDAGNQTGRNFGVARTVSQASTNAGDYDGSNTVDDFDLAVWSANYGSTAGPGMSADANGSGRVDGSDFLLWQRSYSSPSNVSALRFETQPDHSESLETDYEADILSSLVTYQSTSPNGAAAADPTVQQLEEVFAALGDSSYRSINQHAEHLYQGSTDEQIELIKPTSHEQLDAVLDKQYEWPFGDDNFVGGVF